jgi:hypothetical protein
VIPADNKRTMRLLVSRIVLKHLESLPMSYPKLGQAQLDKLDVLKKALKND